MMAFCLPSFLPCTGSVLSIVVESKNVVSMVHPSGLAMGGWDCSSTDLVDTMNRAQVFEPELQRQICPH